MLGGTPKIRAPPQFAHSIGRERGASTRYPAEFTTVSAMFQKPPALTFTLDTLVE
jgi:hypothetical protein